MATNSMAFCAACMRYEPLDANWRALWIDCDGDLRISRPERSYDRCDAVLACGEGSALVLTERYLHLGTFQAAQELHLSMYDHPLT